MKNCLLSVVTVNLNNVQGLKRTIGSFDAFNADASVEFICVDGGSEDGSVEVAKEFYRDELCIVGPDCGIYDAMNKGLSITNGEFVIWMNSGDVFLDGVMRRIQKELTHTKASMVAFNLLQRDQDNQVSERKNLPQRIKRHGLWHQATFFRRSSAVRHGGYDLKYRISADRHLISKIFFSGEPVDFVDYPVAEFGPAGASSNYRGLSYDYLYIDREFGIISYAEFTFLKAKYLLKDVLGRW